VIPAFFGRSRARRTAIATETKQPNSQAESRGKHNIIAVLACSQQEILLLVHRGWSFGVLERDAAPETSGAACPAPLARAAAP
jgi:hypothetical protein